MESILFLSPVESSGDLGRPALEALGRTIALAGELTGGAFSVALVGADVQPAANSIAGCGASRILAVSGAPFSSGSYSVDAAAFAALTRTAEASIVVAPATSRVARSLPGAAAKVGGRVDTHVTAIDATDGSVTVHRWYYRQRMEATLSRTQRPWVISYEPGASEAWSGDPGTATVEPVEVDVSSSRTRVLSEEAATGDAQTTIRPEADLLLVAGAGWTKKQADGQSHVSEAEELILGLVERAQASLGSSKSLVDQSSEGQEVLSFMSHHHQVGQTGSTPRHPKGLATCCHGEEPHAVGWRFIRERRAVNTDPGCSWAQGKADVLYVADAFEVVREVNRLLDE